MAEGTCEKATFATKLTSLSTFQNGVINLTSNALRLSEHRWMHVLARLARHRVDVRALRLFTSASNAGYIHQVNRVTHTLSNQQQKTTCRPHRRESRRAQPRRDAKHPSSTIQTARRTTHRKSSQRARTTSHQRQHLRRPHVEVGRRKSSMTRPHQNQLRDGGHAWRRV